MYINCKFSFFWAIFATLTLKTMFEDYKITLASNSPRRRELLSGLGVKFTVEPNKDESEAYTDEIPWNEVPAFLAKHKADTFHRELKHNEILITADTLVFLPDGKGGAEILGKPTDREDAVRILKMLSGRTHLVLTGVHIRLNGASVSFTSSTEVTFKTLAEDQIDYYIDNYRPYDKAGAYGVQEWIGYTGITGINGSYYNVMGLPVQRLYEALTEITR